VHGDGGALAARGEAIQGLGPAMPGRLQGVESLTSKDEVVHRAGTHP
jgi:hypothetical protein